MEANIKQRLSGMSMSQKKKDGERYEKVQRGSEEEEEEEEEERTGGNYMEEDGEESEEGEDKGEAEDRAEHWWARLAGKWRDLRQNAWRDVAIGIKEARCFPRDMYYVFALKFLESYSYFALSQILVLYLHEEFGVADVEAGMVYGMWGAAITCGGLLVSWLNDNLGVKKSLCIGFTISLISSLIVALTTSKLVLYITLFVFYPFGTAMGIPMLTVAVKRYTVQKNRGFAFGMYYSVMNMAALVSGPVVDGLYIGLKGKLSNGWSGYRVVILTCGFSNLVSLFLSLRYVRDVNIEEGEDTDNIVDNNSAEKNSSSRSSCNQELYASASPLHYGDVDIDHSALHHNASNMEKEDDKRVINEYTPVKQNPWTTAKDLCRSKTFWRFSILTLFLVNLHAIFRHLDATLPTYLVRCFGDNVPKGSLYSINPFMIIFLTPIVAACTTNSNHFDMIKWGGFVTAASPFFLAVDTSIAAVVGMLVVLSLGEAIWSPRLYDYVMTIAPEGREASFSALASAPLFAAKIPVGLMSGYLLHTYLPEEDENGDAHQRPQTMWLIIGLMTLTSPVLIAIFDSCIREPEKEEICVGDDKPSYPTIDENNKEKEDKIVECKAMVKEQEIDL